METTVDVTKLTADQLRAALALKEGRVTGNGQKCSFVPKRSDQIACTENPEVQYGISCYCKKHKRTVQAMKAKKDWEDVNSPPEITPMVETPEVVPVVVTPVVKPEVVPVVVTPVVKPEVVPVVVTPVVTPESIPQKKKTVVETKPKAASKKVDTKAAAPVKKRVIGPNKWGRFEDLETGIIFDPKSKAAYGVQDHKEDIPSLYPD